MLLESFTAQLVKIYNTAKLNSNAVTARCPTSGNIERG